MAIQFLKGKPKAPPIDRVKELTSKGFSEIEIIDILRKEGYSPQEIDLALSQALKESIEKSTKKESPEQQQQTDITKRLEELAQSTQNQNYAQNYTQNQINWEDYLSYVDYIIQNRVNEIVNEVKLMEEKYQNMQKRIEDIVYEVKNQKNKEGELKSEFSQNFYNLEKTIKDLSIRIEGMEEILKEILPTLIDSVRTLNSLLNTLTKRS